MLRLSLFLVLLPAGACAAEVSLGVEGGVSGPGYDTRPQYWVLPYLGYDDGRLYIQGTEGGVYLLRNEIHELKLKAYYFSDAFRASDARTDALRRLSDRHGTLMAGISYMYTSPWGALSTSLSADTLNNSQGVTGNVAYLAKETRESLTFVQEIGVDWSNAQQNRYYWGVSPSEAYRSGLERYAPGSTYTPYISVALDYLITPRWETYAELTGKYLPSTIRKSPMVDNSVALALTVGVNYNF